MSAEPEARPGDEHPAPQASPQAWQPFTPGGVAAFAGASTGRLLVMQLLMALLVGLVVGWFVAGAWFPPVRKAIHQLPAKGEIAFGRLDWTNHAPVALAGNNFLAIVIDPAHTGQAGQAADMQIEFGRTNVAISGLLGSVHFPYPKDGVAGFNRRDLVPWWGAWSQAILTCAIAGTAVYLMLVWALLAALYAPAAKTIAYLFNRALSWSGAWRLAGAALMPGAVLLSGAVVLYGWSLVDVVRLGFVAVFHLVVGWVYLFVSTIWLPRAKEAAALPKGNPFGDAAKKDSGDSKDEKDANPFKVG